MIHFFSGTPGSGKSYHMAVVIDKELRKGHNVISNFAINEASFDRFKEKHPGKLGQFIYCPNVYWFNNSYLPYVNKEGRVIQPPKGRFSYIDGLYGFAKQFAKRNKRGHIIEGQIILVLDECQNLFNPRSWNRADRLAWNKFFSEHRHLGYDVYMLSQNDMLVDKQIRALFEYEYLHRCVNNYKLLGKILGFMAGGKVFSCVKKYRSVSGKDAKVGAEFISAQQRYYNFYDSYADFTQEFPEPYAEG